MSTKSKNKTNEISIEELAFEQRFPDHVLEMINEDNDLVHFKVHVKESTSEEFEFIINMPYVIVMGDWNPAIYKFNLKYVSQLNGITNEEMECKCNSNNHNCYFHKALQFYFEELYKMCNDLNLEEQIQFDEEDFEMVEQDHTVALLKNNMVHRMEQSWGILKPCEQLQIYENESIDKQNPLHYQIAFWHDNKYDDWIANDKTGDWINSQTSICHQNISFLESKINKRIEDLTKDEIGQYFWIFSKTTRRRQHPLIVKINEDFYGIAPLAEE